MTVWPLLLLILVVTIQNGTGSIVFSGDALVLIFYLVLCVFMLVIGYAIGHEQIDNVSAQSLRRFVPRFATLIVVVGLVSVAIALVQVLDIWNNASWILRMPALRRPGGNLGQPNQLATLVLMALASLTYLYEFRRFSKFVGMLIAGVLLLGLAVTESRSGALGLLLLATWWMTKRRRVGFTLSAQMGTLWLFFFACCFLLWPTCFNFIQEGGWTESTLAQVNTSAGTRLVVWPQLWAAVRERPWLGWGLGEISTAHNAVLHTYAESEPFTYAHNIVLDLAVGIGLPLTLLLFGATVLWLLRRVRMVNDVDCWYCLAVVLPFGVHSMLEFPFAYSYLLVPVMFLVGVLEARLSPRFVVRIPWRMAAMCWALASATMAWSVVEYIALEEDFRIARFEAMRMGKTPTDHERPSIYLLTQLAALVEGTRIVPMPGMSPDRIELARNVAMRFPWPASENRYALSLALNGDTVEAIRQLKVIRARHGDTAYQRIRTNWEALAENKYPQLSLLKLP